jgi:hypothetical protein
VLRHTLPLLLLLLLLLYWSSLQCAQHQDDCYCLVSLGTSTAYAPVWTAQPSGVAVSHAVSQDTAALLVVMMMMNTLLFD